LKKSLNGALIKTASHTRFFGNPLFEMENPGGVDFERRFDRPVRLKNLSREEPRPSGAVIIAPRSPMNADPIYSAISVGCAGPASGRSSIRIMQIDAATIMEAAAPNT
jgi:hypothetical protein